MKRTRITTNGVCVLFMPVQLFLLRFRFFTFDRALFPVLKLRSRETTQLPSWCLFYISFRFRLSRTGPRLNFFKQFLLVLLRLHNSLRGSQAFFSPSLTFILICFLFTLPDSLHFFIHNTYTRWHTDTLYFAVLDDIASHLCLLCFCKCFTSLDVWRRLWGRMMVGKGACFLAGNERRIYRRGWKGNRNKDELSFVGRYFAINNLIRLKSFVGFTGSYKNSNTDLAIRRRRRVWKNNLQK